MYLFKDFEIAGKESVGNYQKHLKRNTCDVDELYKNNQYLVSLFLNNVDLCFRDVWTLYDNFIVCCNLMFTKNILEDIATKVLSKEMVAINKH
ncbi:hypothetical protein HYD76_02945 [Mycoplasmopsis bovis]|nr:hypothetical protein HYD76_02945 [Mycoplasmopsis bovis]